MRSLALYTTIYPASEPFLADWYRSVREQTDCDFELWIALHGMEIASVSEVLGEEPTAHWLKGSEQATPAQIRRRSLEHVVESCEEVVLVDSDDVLCPGRVASARAWLHTSDLAGCALRLVDQNGTLLKPVLRMPSHMTPDELLPRRNVFGLSNTAWRADLLRQCLSIPASVAMVDWFLATQAWLLGARMAFDDEVGMHYRQHGANMVRVVAPFDHAQVVRETEFQRHHFRMTLESPPEGADSRRLDEVVRAATEVGVFRERVVARSERLEHYVKALNTLDTAPVWGVAVANPALRHLWISEEDRS